MNSTKFRSKIVHFFASIKLAVFLIILIGLFALLAIVLEEYFPVNFDGWQHYYQQRLGMVRFNILHFMGVFDPYHSFWFVCLLGLLVVNVAVCTLKRTRAMLVLAFRPTFRDTPEKFTKLNLTTEMESTQDKADTLKAVSTVLKGHHYRISTSSANTNAVYAAKGRSSRLGYLFFHLGLIILMLGGLIIALCGNSEFLWGKQGDILHPSGASFALKIEKFEIETTAKGMVRDFLATLAVLEDDTVSFRKEVEVNFPLRYLDYTIYQSSYRVETMEAETLVFRILSDSPPTDTTLYVTMGESIWLSDFGCEFQVLRFLPDFKMAGDSVFSASNELRNPAALYRLRLENGTEISQWSFIRFPDMKPLPDTISMDIRFVNMRPQLYTGLHVSRKPGSRLIWAGLILMTLGLVLSFYIFHRRLWLLVVTNNHAQTIVHLGGDSPKNKPAFRREFDKMVYQLKKNLK